MMSALFALVALLAAEADAPYPLTVRAGQTLALCKTNTISCPAASPICDDTSIVDAHVEAEGLVLRGVKPGKTLCSAASDAGRGPRRVYAVTVVP